MKISKNGSSGRDCTFIKIDGKGLKIYPRFTKEEVEEVRDRQNLAFRNQLGPETFEVIEVELHGKSCFGYYTELVEIIPSETKYQTIPGNYQVSPLKFFTEKQELEKEELIDNLLKNGFGDEANDLYECNVGWKTFNGRRTMICIDFA